MKTRVPSKDYRRQYAALWGELGPRLERLFLEEEPVLGASVDAFEQAFANYLGCAHAVGVGSGTDALALSLRALGVGEGDEVVTAANTFVATVTAIVGVGARPVLIDPDPVTLNLTAALVERALGPRTRAVVPVHLYGRAAPVVEIEAACAERGVALLEDGAQAHGAREPSGRRVGSVGRLAAFSFHPSKNLGAFGDGGLVATSDAELARELRCLRNLGKTSKYEVGTFAPNSKLDTLQAAVLGLKLEYLDTWNARRQEHAAHYRARLADVPGLTLPAEAPAAEHVYHLFVVRCAERDALREHLRSRGVTASLHYPIPPHRQLAGRDLGYAAGDFPVTEDAARTVLSLPIAPELTGDEIATVCDEVLAFFGHGASS